MAWLTLSVHAEADYAEALSDALLERGALSVDMLDADAGTPDEQAIFGEPGEPAPAVWQHNQLNALFPEGSDVAAIFQACCASLGLDPPPEHSIQTLPDNDWVRLTQAQFDPIPISKRLWIVPTWHEPRDPAAINIALDPGLAFGTGSHPTTRLCLRWLDAHIKGGESVLDYGCGSGILAIAALKLGAASAVGVDLDPQAVQASRDNAAANGVTAAFHLPEAAPAGKQYDVVIANILTNPLRMLAPLLAQATRSGGHLVLSGILVSQAEEIRSIYSTWFDFLPQQEEEGWVCLSGSKRPEPGIAQCPGCGTRFRVTPEQLHAHQGMVRCGQCRAVFNALGGAAPGTGATAAAETGVQAPPAQTGTQAAASPGTAAESAALEGMPEAMATVETEPALPLPGLPPDPAPQLPGELEPDLAPQEESGPQQDASPRRRKWPWVMGSALLAAALLLQAAYFYRVELAAQLPGLKPVLNGYCQLLGCTVPLPANEELIGIETSEMSQLPDQPHVIQLDFLLHNRAPYAQAYPDIELTLLDMQEQVLARRIFHPAEYLKAGVAVEEGLAGHRDAVARLLLDTGDLVPVGYRLLLFYPTVHGQ